MKKNIMRKSVRIVKSGLAALMAVMMAIPVASLATIGTAAVTEPVEVEAADVDLPNPIMTLDFERGFKGEAEDGLVVKQSKERLMYEEYKENDAYVKDSDGNYIFKWTDKPVIYGTDDAPYYQKGTFGNQPTTYDDPEKGNTFALDSSMEAEWIIKTESDRADSVVPVYTGGFDPETGEPLDKEAAEASTLQIEHTAHSAAQIKNPFAGLPLSETPINDEIEGPQWTKGVTISYWVKVPTKELEEGETEKAGKYPNDSILFTFENIQRPEGVDESLLDPNGENVTYEVNGYIKYEAARDYDPEDPMYRQGTLSTLVDNNTNTEYKVLSDYGPLVRLTPDYPGSATNEIYFRDDEKTSTPDATISIMENGRLVQAKLFKLGPNIYNDYKSLDTNEGSLVARGYINGSMQIAASNSFHFKEDDYYSKTVYDENGNPVGVPVSGATDINPNNTENKGEFRQFRHYNCYYFDGDGTVNYAPDEWHYVTCVIMNDWTQFYVDGEEIETDDLFYHGTPFNIENGKKYFNKGFGMRYPYHRGWLNVADWAEDGTFTTGPSNCIPQTMLDWITDEDTVLYLGYQGICAEATEQEIGTLDGVLLDDITFYDVPLTSEQATVLYDQAYADFHSEKTAPQPIKELNFDSDANLALPANMTEVETNNSSKVESPAVVNEAEYGHVLKLGDSKSATTSALNFENPYKGDADLEGATISYWVKSTPIKRGNTTVMEDGLTISFIDSPKVLEHGKIQESVQGVPSRTVLYANLSCDAVFMAGYDTKVYESLKNHYKQSTKKNGNIDPDKDGYEQDAFDLDKEWKERLSSLEDWHYVTMVLKNSGITMYFDGVKHENNQADLMGPTFYGPRFYDGYYNRVYDSFAHIKFGTGNQGATSLLEFLTQEDTEAYFGYANQLGSSTLYSTTELSYLDDVKFYDVAMTDAEVEAAYADAVSASSSKAPVAGEPIFNEPTDPNETEAPAPTPPPTSVVGKQSFTDTEDGKRTATANGVTITADKASIPDNAELSVTILGTADKADRYTAANTALKAASIDPTTQTIQLYDIQILVDGKAVTPTGELTVTLTPPSGFTASKTSIVRMSDVKSMQTTVSGSSLVYKTDSLGEFAVMQKKNTTSGNASSSGTTKAGKTSDTVSVVVPVVLLGVAFCAIAVLRKKEELMED